MKPKLKGSVYFMPVQDGIYFAGMSGRHITRGKNIYKRFEMLLTYLNGEYEVEQIVKELPENFAKFSKEMIALLHRWDYLIDASSPDVLLESSLAETYESTVRYLQDVSSTPGTVFKTFRNSVIVLCGNSKVSLATIRSLISMGTRQIVAIHTDSAFDEKLDLVSNELKAEGFHDFEVLNGVENIPNDSQKLIIYAEDQFQSKDWDWCVAFSKQSRIPILPVLQHNGSVLLGPWCGTEATYCSSCYQHYFLDHDRNPGEISQASGRLAGNVITMEILRSVGNLVLNKNSCTNSMIEITEDLETLNHPAQSPFICVDCRLEKESLWSRDFPVEEMKVDEAVLEKLGMITDPLCGLIESLDEGELLQTTFGQCLMNVFGEDPVIIAARSNLMARYYGYTLGSALFYRKQWNIHEDSHELVISSRSSGEAVTQAVMLHLENELYRLPIDWQQYQEPLNDRSIHFKRMIELHGSPSPVEISYVKTNLSLFASIIRTKNSEVVAVHTDLETAVEDALARTLFSRDSGYDRIYGYPAVMPAPMGPEDYQKVIDSIKGACEFGTLRVSCKEYPCSSFVKEAGLKVFGIKVERTSPSGATMYVS